MAGRKATKDTKIDPEIGRSWLPGFPLKSIRAIRAIRGKINPSPEFLRGYRE